MNSFTYLSSSKYKILKKKKMKLHCFVTLGMLLDFWYLSFFICNAEMTAPTHRDILRIKWVNSYKALRTT